MRLILVRHGQTEWNRLRRIQGISDQGLNETGRKQAEALAEALKDKKVAAIYTSPLKRARDTAQAIGRHHAAEIVTLLGLREMDAGEVDGLTYKEMAVRHGDFLEKWMKDCASVRPPGGCSLPELQDQVWEAIEGIVDRQRAQEADRKPDPSEVVIVVSHFFSILTVLCKVLGQSISECRRMRLDLASLCTLDFEPSRIVLVSMNDTCHLRGSAA
jgi:broad specificity phosphatase PhoE